MKMIFVKFNLPAEHPHILSLLGLPARTSQKFKEPWVQKTTRILASITLAEHSRVVAAADRIAST
jgi:hypothetical protein